jgi:hypothetical protein
LRGFGLHQKSMIVVRNSFFGSGVVIRFWRKSRCFREINAGALLIALS